MKIAAAGGGLHAAALAVHDGRTFRARLGYNSFGPVVMVRIADIDVPPESTAEGKSAAAHLARILAANESNRINVPLIIKVKERQPDLLICDVEIQMPFAANRRQRRREGPGPVSGRMTKDAAGEMVDKGHATRMS